MAKKDLERENKFLLSQLELIHERVEEYFRADVHDWESKARIMGGIDYLSDISTIMENFHNIDTTIDNGEGGSL